MESSNLTGKFKRKKKKRYLAYVESIVINGTNPKFEFFQVERVVSPNPLVDTVKSNDSDKTLSGKCLAYFSGKRATSI